MQIIQYIENLDRRYRLGNATEHTFRGDLQHLLESLLPEVQVTNEPKRQSCGAPDYILTRKNIPIGFIEAKDIGDHDLDGKRKAGNKEQFDRYRASLNNLIFTDYLNFHLYREEEFITKITIGEVTEKGIKPLPENFAKFEHLIRDFSIHVGQTIKSSKKLAKMMAGKARLLSDIIGKALTSDEETRANSSLKDQKQAFKEILIHDITPEGFADVYAQTIAYGLFAARLHDPTPGDFSRQEAAELIPKSNPFLRRLFQYIAGYDLDDRIRWVVDDLVQVFLACNVKEMLKSYGKATRTEDPVIHFYEDFLSEYDPKLRKSRGVWYTPLPVVDFIVRGVDDILKKEFNLPRGLADIRKTTIKVDTQTFDKRSSTGYRQVEKEVHKVQILDPATGTGTFLAQIVRHIYEKFEGQQGIWSHYVEEHLIPRLNGFELLMASYTMAHLKLNLLLNETGYNPQADQRLRVYLTNSLEEYHPDTGTLFASWLSAEANEANYIKRDTPVMCVIGNPPYSGESANKGEWIMELMEDYKKEPGGKIRLQERNPKWINDDYVKFMRYGQHFIEKNGEGILAFINPHGFLDNPTFRGMRWHLLKTYDAIYTIDLHGNAKKKETAPDGSKDENVFDIMQGVSINFFIKTGKKKPNEPARLFHYDLFGRRAAKYDFLTHHSFRSIGWKELKPREPNLFFVPKDYEVQEAYNEGFSVADLFPRNSLGIVTARDNFTVHFTKDKIESTIKEFLDLEDEKARIKFNLGKDVRDWQVNFAKKDLQTSYPDKGKFVKVSYRPFDERWTFYTGKSKGFHCFPRFEVMQHFFNNKNIGISLVRRSRSGNFVSPYLTSGIVDKCIVSTLDNANIFPLYLYPEPSPETNEEEPERIPNLNMEIVEKFVSGLGLKFTPEKLSAVETAGRTDSSVRINESSGSLSDDTEYVKESISIAPIDILDYIYAVLHSPEYREKYKEFLKIDFPRVPYPEDEEVFWQLVQLGGKLREIHLLESDVTERYITRYPIGGSNEVTRSLTKNSPGFVPGEDGAGKVWINEDQYFDGVPESAWDFYIGGYQPAQKWLKDRRGRTLGFEDILHYQKIIVALTETDRLMKEIDRIGIEGRQEIEEDIEQ